MVYVISHIMTRLLLHIILLYLKMSVSCPEIGRDLRVHLQNERVNITGQPLSCQSALGLCVPAQVGSGAISLLLVWVHSCFLILTINCLQFVAVLEGVLSKLSRYDEGTFFSSILSFTVSTQMSFLWLPFDCCHSIY